MVLEDKWFSGVKLNALVTSNLVEKIIYKIYGPAIMRKDIVYLVIPLD